MTTHQSMEAISGSIISPADHAVMGAQMGSAGFSDAEVSNLLAMVERKVTEQAQIAARTTALSVVTTMVDIITKTHRAAGMEIYRQLCNQTAGFGGTVTHRKCANIALNVANGAPRHIPQPATPIIGSIH